jgi:UDP-N-acetylmuramoylalanine--D-glutamate ligase
MIKVKEEITTFKDKKVLVVGLARSGVGAANLLSLCGAEVTITDTKSGDALSDSINRLNPDIHVVAGDNPPELFSNADLIVISPGVPSGIRQLQSAQTMGIPVIGELELAFQTVAGSKLRVTGESLDYKPVTRNAEPATLPFIGVTGTNGKSTVTTLVNLMLNESGYQTLLGGNIGNALTEEILKKGIGPEHLDYIVAEISSFQLETIHTFRPKVAAILNITPDHLDRYENIAEYINAKARIFENQTSDDYLILNADDPLVLKMIEDERGVRGRAMPNILYFSGRREVEGIYAKEGMLYCNLTCSGLSCVHLPLFSVDEISIKGIHNLENSMAASLVSLVSGCSQQSIKTVLRSFHGLEHRLEPVANVNGVEFINDSKGTNMGAVAKSLEGLENVILIMGGLDKGSDFSALAGLVREKVKQLILFGAAKDTIAESLGTAVSTNIVNDLKQAVEFSVSKATAGDTVLFSPGCASFDMFKDFEERGREFKKIVRELS